MDDDDIVQACLRGLPSNFNVFKTSMYAIGIPTFDELIPKLLQEEQNTKNSKDVKDWSEEGSFYAGRGKHKKERGGRWQRRGRNQSYGRWQHEQYCHGTENKEDSEKHNENRRGRGRSIQRGGRFQSNRGRFQGNTRTFNPIKCSYCNKIGHHVQDCWIRQSDVKNEKLNENNYASTSTAQIEECDENALAVTICKSSNDVWYLDSGCSNHMTGDHNLFDETKSVPTPIEICMGDDSSYEVKSSGDVELHLSITKHKKLKDVWFVPGVTKNLMSIGQLVEKAMDVLFNKSGCTVSKSNT